MMLLGKNWDEAKILEAVLAFEEVGACTGRPEGAKSVR
jgi:hypothetical protein